MRLIILGSGGYCRSVLDIAEQLGYDLIIVLDDVVLQHPLASFTDNINDHTEVIPAFGNHEFRLSWCEKISTAGGTLATLIHSTAYVSPRAYVSSGTVILAA